MVKMLLPVNYIINTFKPIYPEGEDWDATIQFMKDSIGDQEILTNLSDDFKRDTSFRNPIYVGKAVRNDDSEYDAILNGTHRVVTAFLHSPHTVLEVEFEKEETDEEESIDNLVETEFEPLISVTFFLNDRLTDEEDDQIIDDMFSFFRSIKVTNNIWVTSDMASYTKNEHVYYYEGMDTTVENLALLNNKINQLVLTQPKLNKYYVKHSLDIIYDEEDM